MSIETGGPNQEDINFQAPEQGVEDVATTPSEFGQTRQPDYVRSGMPIYTEGLSSKTLFNHYDELETSYQKIEQQLASLEDKGSEKARILQEQLTHLEENRDKARRAYQEKTGQTPEDIASWERNNESWKNNLENLRKNQKNTVD